MLFPMSILRFLAVWVAMAVAMSMNGIARELLLKRMLPPRVADLLSALLGIGLIALITRQGFRGAWPDNTPFRQIFTVSMSLIVLTVAFETAMGRWVDHKSWTAIVEHYAIWRGELWLVVLLWLGLTPFVWRGR